MKRPRDVRVLCGWYLGDLAKARCAVRTVIRCGGSRLCKMETKKIALIILLTLCLCLAVTGAALAMSSSNHQLPCQSVSTGGGDRGSANYLLSDTVGQSSAIGVSESINYRLQSGYWYAASKSGTGTEVAPPAVGAEVYPPDKLGILAPWLGLALILALAIGWGILSLRRCQAH